jgi:DNA-binding protein HU-beta
MNKIQLVDAIAAKARLTKVDARRALDAFIGVTAANLKKGEGLTLIGFGSFSVVKRKERKGRNPQTGAALKIPARKVVRFKPGAELKGMVSK